MRRTSRNRTICLGIEEVQAMLISKESMVIPNQKSSNKVEKLRIAYEALENEHYKSIITVPVYNKNNNLCSSIERKGVRDFIDSYNAMELKVGFSTSVRVNYISTRSYDFQSLVCMFNK